MLLNDREDSPLKAIDFGLAVFFDPDHLPRTDLGLDGTPWWVVARAPPRPAAGHPQRCARPMPAAQTQPGRGFFFSCVERSLARRLVRRRCAAGSWPPRSSPPRPSRPRTCGPRA
jgi:hypothetical protein